MANYRTDFMGQLNGARMVVTEECEMCDAFGISYWNGGTTVNWAVLHSGRLLGEDVWTNYELEKMPLWEVEQALRAQLKEDLCPCVTEAPLGG